jgi:hypothetical protein
MNCRSNKVDVLSKNPREAIILTSNMRLTADSVFVFVVLGIEEASRFGNCNIRMNPIETLRLLGTAAIDSNFREPFKNRGNCIFAWCKCLCNLLRGLMLPKIWRFRV